MIDALVVASVIVLAGLALAGLALTVLARPPGRELRIAGVVTLGLLVVQAAVAAVRTFAGEAPPETSTFLIYLVVSVCVLPIATQFAYAEPSRWGGAVVAAGAIGTAVAVIRLQGLWNG